MKYIKIYSFNISGYLDIVKSALSAVLAQGGGKGRHASRTGGLSVNNSRKWQWKKHFSAKLARKPPHFSLRKRAQ